MIARGLLRVLFPAAALGLYSLAVCLPVVAVPKPKQHRVLVSDPAAWGTDHVGKPPPEYPSGDQCLFCHRKDVAPTWNRNPHNRTVRPVEQSPADLAALQQDPGLKSFAAETTHLLGGRRRLRLLRTAKAYGHLELLSAQWQPARDEQPARVVGTGSPRWDAARFGDRCAGCHATAVDPASKAFLAHSLDCGSCHGTVEAAHSTNPKLALLSPARKDPARVVASLCGSCHLRGGVSRSTGRPYPNNFVPGDNLFRDFRFDFASRKVQSLPPAERHVVENVRDVALLNRAQVTCLSCHSVHQSSTARHRTLAWQTGCRTCHAGPGKRPTMNEDRHSTTCEY